MFWDIAILLYSSKISFFFLSSFYKQIYEQLIQNKVAQNIDTCIQERVENKLDKVVQTIKECATKVDWTEKTKNNDGFNKNI